MRQQYTDAVCHELEMRRDYMGGETVETIYFGGGTPSQLPAEQLKQILDTIYYIYNVRAKEITIECNPDDICPAHKDDTSAYCGKLLDMGFDRISIGVQSFKDEILNTLKRRHSGQQAARAVRKAHDAGFNNISIDLMFSLPGQSMDDLADDLRLALSLPITHLSVYSLMFEEGTQLYNMLQEGKVKETDEETARAMYELILDKTRSNGMDHYEISNFARQGFESKHNSSYWKSIPYIGVGAGAHSFNGDSRQYNCESLTEYISSINQGILPKTQEVLSNEEKYNEMVFTSLRTREGLSLKKLKETFGSTLYNYCIRMSRESVNNKLLVHTEDDTLRLTRNGLFISNSIMSDLMYIP